MITTYKIPNPITILRDDLILEQLPSSVLEKLGDTEETGFHLGANRRDLFCKGGAVQYVLGSDKATVELDQ